MNKNPQDDEPDHDAEQQSSDSPQPSRQSRSTNIPLNMRADLLVQRQDEEDDDREGDNARMGTQPLLPSRSSSNTNELQGVRARGRRRRRRHRHNGDSHDEFYHHHNKNRMHSCLMYLCRHNASRVQCTFAVLRWMWQIFVSLSIVLLVISVFWHSYQLHQSNTAPIKIAHFSAGAFVLLGFPISMYGIIMHLSNYNQPHVQVYIVRILWMVPIYSIESWLAMRFHRQAIYIETLRDFYESYVLYSFLQFLIQVLGGEESLILMLKDKSPTRGFHMWGMQLCLKPWIMGQPVRKTVYERADAKNRSQRAIKRVHWKSPFFVQCKFGVLQYVLLKLLSAIAVLLLEWKGRYKEGNFSWKSGYLYICILTNLSQCWALYCLIFFYLATKNELAPIRPVGKFLSVKALVFFTWWQSVMLAIFYQWGMIPEQLVDIEENYTEEDAAKGIQDYLICIEMFVAALVHSFVFPHTEYSPQAVRARSRALDQFHDGHANKLGMEKWNSRRLGRSKYHPHPYARAWDETSKGSNTTSGLEMTSVDSPYDNRSRTDSHTFEDPLLWHSVQPQQQVPTKHANLDIPWELTPSSSKKKRDLEALTPEPAVNPTSPTLTPVLDLSDDDECYETADDDYGEETDTDHSSVAEDVRPGFVGALIDSVIPRDLGNSTMGIVKGDYNVEKKTLLSVATTSDQYDLFSPMRRPKAMGDKL